ncbi:MAG: TldD/PmbA family protein [Synechococcaceae cyanobacterium RL_1_2]|nr:TldD/PmbA family protein [Synechococcaceae cyanobacterium RL_1_2]
MALALPSYQQQVAELIHRYRDRVDFLAIRLEKSVGTNIVLRGDRTETLTEGTSLGGQVRACHRGGWGFTSFNNIAALPQRIEDAIAAAKLIGEEETILAEVAPVQTECVLPITGTNPRLVSIKAKKELCDRYNQILQGVSDRISTTSVSYGDLTQEVLLATSEGTMLLQSWADLEMRFSAVARDGNTIQTGRETIGSRKSYDDLLHLDQQVQSAADRAIKALTLPTVKGNTYPVVIDPILTGLFVHEAFGHLSEADMAYENPDLLEVMSFGRRFGPDNLQIFDGAAPEGHRGSYYYDDEGTPATTTQLIKDGVLVGRLHSRETAGKLGEQATGNARCLSYHYSPIVRMTNTWIGRGDTPAQEF